MAHDKPPHQNLRCLQIQLFSLKIINPSISYSPSNWSSLNLSSYFAFVSIQFLPKRNIRTCRAEKRANIHIHVYSPGCGQFPPTEATIKATSARTKCKLSQAPCQSEHRTDMERMKDRIHNGTEWVVSRPTGSRPAHIVSKKDEIP